MKNLKQVLALGMAFSLTMSTMAGAAFTDQDSINKANTEAVDLLTNLSIIKGYEDGSFKPEGTVTRAEMAKMIYTIRNGGNDDASAYESVDTSFTDIKGHWAEGYIKYLQNTGIVAGKSATKFDPDATVTTAEAMKMALVLGGYRSDKANLTGAEWFNNTVSWATTNQLTDDVFSAMNGPCTRASAAQILANALEMTAVQWSEFVNGFVNDSKSGLAMGSDPITVGNKWMDLTVYVGQMTAAGDLEMTSSGSAGKDRFVVNVDTVDNKSVTSKYETFKDGIDHTDLVGQEVKVLTGDKIDEVYGVYATGTSQVVETTMDKVTVDTANDKFEIGGTKYSVDDAKADVYADTNRSTVAAVFTSNGQAVSDKVKLVDSDNDGKYETVFVETVNVAQVTYVGTDSITIGAVGSRSNVLGTKKTIENSEMSIYEGAAKGDYVAITRDDYNKDNWKVEKATVVTGTVDGVVKNERKVRVDGTWYTLANTKSGSPAYTTLTVPNSIDEFTNKDEVTLYVVGDIVYYAEATRGNDANRPVAMVYDMQTGIDIWGSKNQAKVILADGTKKTVTVSAGKDNVAFASLEKGMIYEYTVNNDGDYLFTALSETNTAGYDFYDKDKDGLNGNESYGSTNSRVIADDAIVFAYIAGKKDATVYTGKTVKDAKLDTGWGGNFDKTSDPSVADFGVALAEKNNGFTYNRMISVAIKDTDKLNSTSNYGYLVTDGTYSYNKEQGAYVMEYSYWNGSEIVNVIEKTSTNKERWAVKGTVIAFSNDGEGLIKDVTNVQNPADVSENDLLRYASMTGADTKGGYISVMNEDGTTNGSLEVTSDTIIYYVNSSAGTTDKIGVSSSGYDYAVDVVNGIRNVNVAYVKTPDNKVKFMVIDVNGKLAGHDGIATSSASENNISDALSKGDVTTAGNLTVDDGLQIPSNRTLTVNGDLTVEPNNARSVLGLVVEGSLVVTGELNVKANAVVSVIKGAAVSTNDMTVDKGSKVTVAAGTTVTVEGTYTGNEYVTGDGANDVVYKNEKDVKATKVSL